MIPSDMPDSLCRCHHVLICVQIAAEVAVFVDGIVDHLGRNLQRSAATTFDVVGAELWVAASSILISSDANLASHVLLVYEGICRVVTAV